MGHLRRNPRNQRLELKPVHITHTAPAPANPSRRQSIADRSGPAVGTERPHQLEVPPSVSGVLARGVVERRFLFPDGAPAREVVRWQAPAMECPGEIAEVSDYLLRLEESLRPARRAELLARVLALLSHFRSEPLPQAVEVRVADDWAEDLGGYPMWAIDEAARIWRRTRRFRPQICEITALCDSAVSDWTVMVERLRTVLDRAGRAANPYGEKVSELARGMIKRLPR